ncbi:hypothetical protein acdb102_21020 [Acidothermaceae bacterium B102]|nr:hypothetical protein acdb102_21020 [Acidothermaceae bacterium B102]
MMGRLRLAIAGTAWATAAMLAVAPLGAGPAAAATGSVEDSAVTVSGAGPFASLKVTVSQTAGLIDQVVRVSWTGGTPTQVGFAADYLQIMQCWGTDAAGPSRDHCEFGNSADTRGGPQVTTRQLDAGATFADPNETQVATADNPYNYVPFVSHISVDDPAHPGQQTNTVPGDRTNLGQLFDSQSTNELPLNSTGADGTGEAYFETQTAEEAPGLGCGVVDPDPTLTPKCWLVIVPRGETEVNGAPSSDNGGGLVSTPLSASNWANRIVVPLTFTPIGLSCPIGSPEQRTTGQESVLEAAHRWNAQLCKQSGTVYSYSKVSDDSARRQLMSANPGLDFISQPVDPTTTGSDGIVYAPIDITGPVIAFNIDYSAYGATALRPLAGQRVPSINLTPRLVAKLLTQSYLQGAPPLDPSLDGTHAPQGLTYDPDFFAANPTLTGLNSGGGDVLMPFTPSDAIQQLWAWVDADPDARAFLDGAADPWGMTVNPNYLKVTDAGPPSSFLKQDPYCHVQGIDNTGSQPPPLCTLDDRPYANDMHDTARSAARGDTLSRAQWDPTPPQPHYKKVPPQISGQETVMAFTDAATAARFSLPVAHLQNASGSFVAPTTDALAAGVAAMTPSAVPGVLQANPRITDPAAYPLTSVTYAATRPGALSASARGGYADYLQYAATAGQKPGVDIGELPFGYAPLTPSMVTQALVSSVAIRTFVAPPASSSPAPATTSPAAPTKKPTVKPTPKATPKPKPVKTTPSPTKTTPSASPVTPSSDVPPPIVSPPTLPAPQPLLTTLAPPAPVPTSAATASSAPAATSAAAQPSGTAPALAPVAEIRPTPSVKAGGSRYVFIILLAIGGLCALSGPTLLRFGGRGRT